MNHWTNKYIGKPYNKRKNNCVHLVIDVYKNELQKELFIPQLEDFSQRNLDHSLKFYFDDLQGDRRKGTA